MVCIFLETMKMTIIVFIIFRNRSFIVNISSSLNHNGSIQDKMFRVMIKVNTHKHHDNSLTN